MIELFFHDININIFIPGSGLPEQVSKVLITKFIPTALIGHQPHITLPTFYHFTTVTIDYLTKLIINTFTTFPKRKKLCKLYWHQFTTNDGHQNPKQGKRKNTALIP
jgi:hypothetical protein